MIGKEYFVRQAAILFGLAKATTDPKISAALLDKAADLKLQVDEPGAPPDLTPIAPVIATELKMSAPLTNVCLDMGIPRISAAMTPNGTFRT